MEAGNDKAHFYHETNSYYKICLSSTPNVIIISYRRDAYIKIFVRNTDSSETLMKNPGLYCPSFLSCVDLSIAAVAALTLCLTGSKSNLE